MSNLKYTLFQSTLKDLEECYDELCEIDGKLLELNPEEAKAAYRMIQLCNDIIVEFGDYS